MDIISRVMLFFHPVVDVPEETEEQHMACKRRFVAAERLRSQLRAEPSIDDKISGITELLKSAVLETRNEEDSN